MLESSEKQKKTEDQTEQDIIEMIDATYGPIIEIGGPTLPNDVTQKAYEIVDITKLRKKLITTNLTKGLTLWEYDDEIQDLAPTGHLEAEVRMDGRKMGLKSSSVGAIFASGLPKDIRTIVLTEAFRVLEPGGVVV